MTVIEQPALPEVATGAPGRLDRHGLRVTNRRVLRSEAFKFSALRSSWIITGLSTALMVLFGWLGSTSYSPGQTDEGGPGGAATDALGAAMSGTPLALLVLGILGIMVGASEYSTGLIKNTLAAVPRRWPVVAAKAAVVGGVSFVAATVGSLAAFLIGGTAIDDAYRLALGDDGVVRSLLGAGAYLAMVGMIGVGLGMLLRNVAGSVAALVGGFLIVPNLADLLPKSLADAITPYLPSNAGESMMALTTADGRLGSAGGLAVLLAWTAVALGAAIYKITQRDA